MRNSVKAVVDAYHGTVDLYIVDDADPVVRAWADIFPDLFKPASAFPPDLVRHWRYPQDYFQVQADQYLSYHIESARGLFTREDPLGNSAGEAAPAGNPRPSPITSPCACPTRSAPSSS